MAQLDSAPPPKRVPMLVAVADGDLCAALPLSDGTAIADPFRRTEEIVAMVTRPHRFDGTLEEHNRPGDQVALPQGHTHRLPALGSELVEALGRFA